MKFVSVKDFKTSPSNIWKKLPSDRELIITNKGKPIALLTPLNDESFEDTISAFRRAKAINAMKKMQEISASLGNNKMTLDEINSIINKTRENNKE
ncbi:MAG: type II toxin-antitoxin system Phd/YefM family antitoxin [Treponema sp.]|jgi:antitoxin (DNA-binding transcriptional repressor) of toxin-antitoxin stability system|nr:type II toxin-antitoxin system Phd/YefM family antitoxin [Treponema sp.]